MALSHTAKSKLFAIIFLAIILLPIGYALIKEFGIWRTKKLVPATTTTTTK